MKIKHILILLFGLFSLSAHSQVLITFSGKVKDKSSGEELTGVGVVIENGKAGTVTDGQGNYSMELKPGTYDVTFSYLGYELQIFKDLVLNENKRLNVQLITSQTILDEIEISGRKQDANVTDLAMSVQSIPIATIRKMPALMGEVDVIKSIQLLPGVQAAAEGSSGFSVRGGGTDQNLILFDNATIYNASHLMGFFSVFNNDVVEDATLYKGDIPAIYGGRLSSVLDVATRTPNTQKFKGSGGIGLISSRLELETPIIKDKLSVMAAGRRTYADLFLPLASNEHVRNNTLYFYDLNAKLYYNINENNRVYASGYFGRDKFGTSIAGMTFGNASATAHWNHIFTKTFFMNTSFVFSQYAYGMDVALNDLGMEWTSKIEDYTGKLDFVKLINTNNTLRFGLGSTYHYIRPGDIKNTGEMAVINNTELAPKHALESNVYISNEQKIGKRLAIKYGVRGSMFQNIGEELIYSYDNDFNKTDSTLYGKGKFFNTYYGIEPRAGLVFVMPSINSSIKAAYSHTIQNMILGSNSNGGMPLDVWFPVNPNIKPEQSDQYTIGFFKNFFDNKLETSVEVYYKTISNLIDFKDNPTLIGNAYLETEIYTGKGRSYGIEILLRKNVGKISGWISYTYSHSFRTVPEINYGKEYRSPFDRPNNFVAVLSYDITPRINVSANWIYNTGQPVTYPDGKMSYGNVLIPVYSGERNTYRYPDYHRLDLSATFKGKEHRRLPWRGEWNISVYNAYGRKNTWAIMFVEESDNPGTMQTQMVYLFSIVPSVTYNFYF